MDSWDFMDEYDILAALPKDFFELIESKKWSDRRDAFQTFVDLCDRNPRLNTNGHYEECVCKIQQIVKKDPNVVVVALAIRSITALVKGLRKQFEKFSCQVIQLVLEKYKETKAAVRSAATDCLDALFVSSSVSVVQTAIIKVFQRNKNPSVSANSDFWIYRILLCCSRDKDVMEFVKSIAPYLVQHSNSGDAEVREASYMVFAGVMRLFGEETTLTLFNNAFSDSVKRKKVDEYKEKAISDAAEMAKAQLQSWSDSKKNGAKDVNVINQENGGMIETGTAVEDVDTWDLLEAKDVSEMLSSDFYALVNSKQWKERKEALETLVTLLEENQRLKQSDGHVKLVGILKTILEKDTNINVVVLAAKGISAFSKGLRYDFASYASTVLPSAFEKFKEKKATLRNPLCECVDSIAIVTPFSNYIECIESALEKGSPQVKAQIALFLSRLWKQHDSQTLQTEDLKKIAHLLTLRTFDPDAECRDASYCAIGAAMKSVGEDGVKMLFADVANDSLKMSKVKDRYSAVLKECGSNASNLIRRLLKVDSKDDKSRSSHQQEHTKVVSSKNVENGASLAIGQLQPDISKTVYVGTRSRARQYASLKTREAAKERKNKDRKRQRSTVIVSEDETYDNRCKTGHTNELTSSGDSETKKSSSSRGNSPVEGLLRSEDANALLQVKSVHDILLPSNIRTVRQRCLTAKYSFLRSELSRIPAPVFKQFSNTLG